MHLIYLLKTNSIDIAAQNCLFNIFRDEALENSINRNVSHLKKHGRLVMSDPTCEQTIPENLRDDENSAPYV